MHTNIVYEFFGNEKGLSKLKGFIKGTFFLMIVIFCSKLLGFVFRMYFMRGAGEEAVGYYMATYPAFIFFISIIQLGLPIAISKLVAEHYARKEFGQIKQLMYNVKIISFSSIFIFVPILLFLAPFIASYFLKNEALLPILQIAIATVPFVIISSSLKAYLQGKMQITPSAVSQLMEQVLRIILVMTVLPLYSTLKSPIQLAVMVMIFTALAEILSFVYIYFTYRKQRVKGEAQTNYPYSKILRIALPAQGSKLFGTFTWFLEPIVFFKALTSTGLTITAATTLYGIISGVHIPLLLFPAFIPAALSIVIIPALSESLARNQQQSVVHRSMLAFRVCSIIGVLACTVFFLYGDELAIELFHLKSHAHYMQILAPIFYFYYIQSPMQAMLQAVGEAKAAMMNSIYGGTAKLFLMLILASQPILQEKGAIIAIGFGVLITSLLHLITLKQHKIMQLSLKPVAFHLLLFIIVSIIFTSYPLPFSMYGSITFTIFVLLILFVLTRQIKADDFRKIWLILRRL